MSRNRFQSGYRRERMTHCYRNSVNLSLHREIMYCEGFACSALGQGVRPVEHGWCVTAEGKVIIVTWREVGLSYFGVTYMEDVIIKPQMLPVSVAKAIEINRRKRLDKR